MWDKLFSTADLLNRGMEASWTRNAVLRNNLANSETPEFKRSDVQFESLLHDALSQSGFRAKVTREKHIPIGQTDISTIQPIIEQDNTRSMRMDGNNVDIEAENTYLAQNSLQYNTLLYKLNSDLARIKLAITEGK